MLQAFQPRRAAALICVTLGGLLSGSSTALAARSTHPHKQAKACHQIKRRRGHACAARARRRHTPARPRRGHAGARPSAGKTKLFAPRSVWNQPVATNAPRDRRSSTYVADLLSQIASAGTWINTYAYSTPVFTVPADQPTVPVTLDAGFSTAMHTLAQSWTAVPLPPNAKAASGTDHHMVIWQPATDTMWELWNANHQSGGWHASWGGTIHHLSTNPGYYTAPEPTWGATATSLPLLGGLIRPTELAAGHIDHALSLAIPQAQAQYFAWPAQRTDGSIYSPTAIPEGQRFRLDPKFNLSQIPMAPIIRMIAEAAKKYGIIVRDQAGAVTFYAEDTDAENLTNPYYGPTGYFQNQYVNNLLAKFPWSHLQALRDKLSCCWHN